jgi:hypothetical protein
VFTVALKEQASQIQMVRAQLEVSKSAAQDGSQQALVANAFSLPEGFADWTNHH